MWLFGVLSGVVLTVAILIAALAFVVRRYYANPSPDWSRPGAIWRGSMDRAREAMAHLFPEAPARSYLSIARSQDPALSYIRLVFADDPGHSDTKFFIRSVGKRDGQHRFQIELRLDASERDCLDRAVGMLRLVGPKVERTDKSYGAIILQSAVVEDWRPLLRVAQRFADDILGGTGVHLSWHLAGRAGG